MAEPNEKQLLAYGLSLLAVLLTASGILVSTLPLASKRPADSEHTKIPHAGRQDVYARLWQDPFTVTRRAAGDSPAARCTAAVDDAGHHPRTLSALIRRRRDRPTDFTVLPVMVPGGPYFENSESRRRARYAVVTALLNSGWVPSDEEKLGYIWTFESCIDAPWLRWAPEILPWEWFSRKPKEALLVLWVDDDALARHPLRGMYEIARALMYGGLACVASHAPEQDGPAKMDTLRANAVTAAAGDLEKRLNLACETSTPWLPTPLKRCDPAPCPEPQSWSPVRVLGPWTSDGLLGLARDVLDVRQSTPAHPWLRFYSSAATAAIDDEFLAAAIEGHRQSRPATTNPAPTPTELAELLRGRLLRLTTPDDTLARGLIKELKRRLSDPDPFWRVTHRDHAADRALCGTTMVIVAERDSSYARLFASAFEQKRLIERVEPDGADLQSLCGLALPQVVFKSYLRGLDGVLPEGKGEPEPPVQSPGGPAPARPEMSLQQAPRERADGHSQYDYLRRLAEDLILTDTRERRGGRVGIRAIGVLGNDVYDKILVLQALRDDFPKAVFFTADLDARMMGADVTRWTRNLVVASAYGLTLNPGLQVSAPPFRDTYQTGLYLSTLVALDTRTQARVTSDFSQSFESPQLFEIGRTRAIALSRGARELCHTDTMSSGAVGTPDPNICSYVHPLDEWSRFPWLRPSTLLGLGVAASAAVMLSLLTFEVLAVKRDVRRAVWRPRSWASGAGLGAAAAVSLAWFCSRIWRDVRTHEGEPFAWLQGVSLWPTVLLRLVVVGVMIALLGYCLRRTSRDIGAVRHAFDLDEPSGMSTRGGRVGSVVKRIRWLWWFNAPGARHREQAGLPVPNAEASPWVAFRERMTWRARKTRIGVSSMLFFLFGVGLLSLDWPNSPHRGVFSAWSDHITFLLVLLVLGVLLFTFLDTACMVTRFAERLGPQMGTLEIKERGRQASWSRIRMDERVRRLATWFRVVVRLGSVVSQLVYLPFVALLLVISTSASIFDIWTLPLAYTLLFVISALLTVFHVARLRRRAASLRRSITDELDTQIHGCELEADLTPHRPPDGGMDPRGVVDWSGLPPQARAKLLKEIRDEILGEREGPFRPLAEDPIVRATLLLLGGTGAAITTAKFLLLAG